MKMITLFKTYSYGGMEGRDLCEQMFETEDIAREFAKRDTWNDGYRLYKVEMIFDGVVKTKETFIGRIPDGRDYKRIEHVKEVLIPRAEQRLEEHKANKRIKETTREKRIKKELACIDSLKAEIKKFENML